MNLREYRRLLQIAVLLACLLFWLGIIRLIASCTSEPPPVVVTTTTSTTTTLASPKHALAPLSWEAGHDERLEWSNYLFGLTSGYYFVALDGAADWKTFCANYDSLSLEQRATVMAELFSALAFFESGWHQDSVSIDVGNKLDKSTWSIGLLQVSQADSQNKMLAYSYDQLLTAKPNLHLGVETMAQQIKVRDKVVLDNTDSKRYWSTLLIGNKYSKVKEVAAMTGKLSFCKK